VDDVVLLPAELDLYRLIAAGEELPPEPPIGRLAALGLITADPYRVGRWIANDPRAAAERLMADARDELTRAAERMTKIPALENLSQHFDPHRWYGGPGSEFLATRAAMNARIGEISGPAMTEILTAQPGAPGDRDPEIVKLGVERTRSALERGVEVRSLYSAIAHSHPQTRAYVEEIVEAGAHVRARAEPFPRIMLIDQAHLLIDNHVRTGAELNSGWHVSDRSVVMWARKTFLLLWGRATRWQDLAHATDSLVTPRQRAILDELAAGQSQPQIGLALGVSERIVNKEVAAVRQTLGARSRDQVMAWWGRVSHEQLP
jgi:DNA-binding CsgD family transcriptional regulator